jgi:ribonuclease T1
VRFIAAFLAVVFSFPAFAKDVSVKELPPEARETLALIKQNGPLPYPQDGKSFSNRERRLPLRAQGEFYYTEDHYHSFRRIKE